MTDSLRACRNIADVAHIARRRLPAPMWDFLEGGAEDEVTLNRNGAAFRDYLLRPRALVDVSRIDPSTRILGQDVSMPLMISPSGGQGLWHAEAELAAMKSAEKANIVCCVSTATTCAMEEIAAAASGPKIFQLYVFKDDGVNRDLIERARAAGYNALCITVDTAAGPGNRERDLAHGLSPGRRLALGSLVSILSRPGWIAKVGMKNSARLGTVETLLGPGKHTLGDLRGFLAEQMSNSFTWKELEHLASVWNGPLAIKGVLTPEDSMRAADAGATAVMVSNHGGRQMDCVPAPIEVLGDIVDAVGDTMEVILDGGVRRGSDIIKALALGARGVMTARPFLYGLAAGGENGVDRVLEIFRDELKRDMGLLGVRSISEIDGSIIMRSGP